MMCEWMGGVGCEEEVLHVHLSEVLVIRRVLLHEFVHLAITAEVTEQLLCRRGLVVRQVFHYVE